MKNVISKLLVGSIAVGMLSFGTVNAKAEEPTELILNKEYAVSLKSYKKFLAGTFKSSAGTAYKIEWSSNDNYDGYIRLESNTLKDVQYISLIPGKGETNVFYLPEGDYTLSINSGFGHETYNYTAKVIEVKDSHAEDERNNSLADAKLINDYALGAFSRTDKLNEGIDVDYYKYEVKKDGLLDVRFKFEDSNFNISVLNTYGHKNNLVIMDSKYHVIGIKAINSVETSTTIGVKKGTYYIVPVMELAFQKRGDGLNYRISINHKKSNKYEKEYNNIPKAGDKFGVEGQINFNDKEVYNALAGMVDKIATDEQNDNKYDKDYVSVKVKRRGTYELGFASKDKSESLKHFKGCLSINGSEPKALIHNADDDLCLKLKLKRGDVIKMSIEGTTENKDSGVWYKSYIKRVK